MGVRGKSHKPRDCDGIVMLIWIGVVNVIVYDFVLRYNHKRAGYMHIAHARALELGASRT